jgi:hypothetical protein
MLMSMRTKYTIAAIVVGCLLLAAAIFSIATLWLGWMGLAVCTVGALVVVMAYTRWVRPWHSRWGTTAFELMRAMPGDQIIAPASSTTRAITIHAEPSVVWPWLVQIGCRKAGWYSYDWIDNDGRPSADHIVERWQNLKPGDQIEMMPGFGPRVVEVVPHSHVLSGDLASGSWCLALYPSDDGCRLVSRWRQNWKPEGLVAKLSIAIADPGAFIMEQKMLRGIKQRAESIDPDHSQRTNDAVAARQPEEVS